MKDLPPVNRANGADLFIIAQLERIRVNADWRPAFRRGRMYFDFDAGKIRVAPTPEHARAC